MPLPRPPWPSSIEAGIRKVALDAPSIFMLAILAGAFIAVRAVPVTTVRSGTSGITSSVVRLFSGLEFTLGRLMVVVAGVELFTSNNTIIMALLSGKVTLHKLLCNWLLVYAGNFVGALLTAYLVLLSRQYAVFTIPHPRLSVSCCKQSTE